MTPRRGKLDEAYFTDMLKVFGGMILFAIAAGAFYTFVWLPHIWPLICWSKTGCVL